MYTYYSNFLYFWMGGFSCWHAFCSISVCVVMDSGSYPCHRQSPIPHTRSIAKPFISTCQGLQYNLCSEKLILLFYFLKGFIYLYFETRERKEKERERNINVWLPLARPQLGNLAHNPGMCPAWELNQWPFASQAGAQSTELQQPGHNQFLKTEN